MPGTAILHVALISSDPTQSVKTLVVQVGVASYREYEETHLKQHKESVEQLTKLRRQEAALKHQLNHERRRDLAKEVSCCWLFDTAL